MLTGVLIAESLRTGVVLDGIPLTVTKISRIRQGDATGEQPLEWTLLRWGAVVPEERYLAAKFGDAYAEYTSRVPRWL